MEDTLEHDQLVNAQQKKVASAQQSDNWLVGLPLYSSDGKTLGQVTEVVTSAGQRAVRRNGYVPRPRTDPNPHAGRHGGSKD